MATLELMNRNELRAYRTRRPRRRRPGNDEGLMALELAIVIPALIVMLLAIVGLGRVTHGRQLVDDAAAAASRAASLAATPAQATDEARSAAAATLSQAGLSCQNTQVDVDTTAFVPGGQVAVTVRCTSQLSGLALTGLPGQMTLRAVARVPIEQYRDLNAVGTP